MIAEIRRDIRKFVGFGLLRKIEGQDWFVVIGLEDTVATGCPTDGYIPEVDGGRQASLLVQLIGRFHQTW